MTHAEIYTALGLEDPFVFGRRQASLNRESMDMQQFPHGLSRQTGRSTRVMVNEIHILLHAKLRHTVAFPFKHHDSPETEALARFDRRRFEQALSRLAVRYERIPLRRGLIWCWTYTVVLP